MNKPTLVKLALTVGIVSATVLAFIPQFGAHCTLLNGIVGLFWLWEA